MGKIIRWWGADVRAAFAYKMVSYTPILLKKFAARHRGEGFFIAKGEAKKLACRETREMEFLSSD